MVPTTGLPTPKVTHDYDTDHGIDDIQVETTTDDGGITTTETHMRVPPGLFYVLKYILQNKTDPLWIPTKDLSGIAKPYTPNV